MFKCVTAVVSENLLAGLGKCHPGKGRGEGFRVHLTARALQVIILPRLSVRRLKHQPTRPHVIKTFMTRKYGRATRSLQRRRVSARRACERAERAATLRGGIRKNGSFSLASKPERSNRRVGRKKSPTLCGAKKKKDIAPQIRVL